MPIDYQGNSRKGQGDEPPEKVPVERVTTGKVLVKKRSRIKRMKDMIIEADFKTVSQYVLTDVIFPAIRNLIVDSINRGSERLVYGERAVQRRNFGPGPRVTYNNPINRGYQSSPRQLPGAGLPPDPRTQRLARDDFVLATREEAQLVLERMNDIIDQYQFASVADLHGLIGEPSNHVDNKWGWVYLGDVQIRQVRDGYLIDFPPAETG